jgi:hypothetical protein
METKQFFDLDEIRGFITSIAIGIYLTIKKLFVTGVISISTMGGLNIHIDYDAVANNLLSSIPIFIAGGFFGALGGFIFHIIRRLLEGKQKQKTEE